MEVVEEEEEEAEILGQSVILRQLWIPSVCLPPQRVHLEEVLEWRIIDLLGEQEAKQSQFKRFNKIGVNYKYDIVKFLFVCFLIITFVL